MWVSSATVLLWRTDVHPSADELVYDDVDDDVDGTDLTDVDRDGYDAPGVRGDQGSEQVALTETIHRPV